MSYVHIIGYATFVFSDFLENKFSGHSTFVLSTINVRVPNLHVTQCGTGQG